MKKQLVLCIIIILLVIIGNVVTQKYTAYCLSEMDKQLIELKENILEEDYYKTNNKIQDIEKNWDKMQNVLAFYIEHDELEKIEMQLSLLKGQIEAKVYKDTFAEIEKCIFILEHIKDKTSLNIKNIF